ncbi:YdcF family protein [Candidatus Uhrbacteria bacterium]|nr:YdcF family protein [Candidatus Uhrbacteria bacterium]
MFTALKLLTPLLLPPMLLTMALIVGIVLLRWPRRHRWGVRILVASVAAFALLSLEPTAQVLAWTLERQHPEAQVLAGTSGVSAIVVLGGGADAGTSDLRDAELGGSSWRRLWKGIAVYRTLGGTAPLIYSGGSGDPFRLESHEAELAKSYAIATGVPAAQFLVEEKSRDTYENGIEVRRLLAEHVPTPAPYRIILVTSARHLPRAMGVFTRLGMIAVPVPADIAVRGGFPRSPLQFFPTADAFASSAASIREWIGMIGYRLRGRM